MHHVYLSLGSNMGNRKWNIRHAVERIGQLIGPVGCQSSLYETKPWGFESPNDFINACVSCSTKLSPRQTLKATQQIERELGRVRKTKDGMYEDRIIDVDILLYDDLSVNEPDLKIPHPLMEERDFVMKPLQEVLKKERDGAPTA
ncbi:2-amino-4-hydroxy-6-hydroxymethyldihydropteridine diphosphokinase [Prevotella sp. kh1p2]|uniref:2-amino-4-hydroxy-6- hydroxymethyldihydropteridine diphosphokinase n=1 Tax=Prevotella sp. kh1p2 TaxID=1761883 RepID=UPI0008CEE46E|nr:2-amino-4-hydroxy-6-hydroxymethyldihydropteridine diphosphokinase [Prevotella sp. kh1p2]SES75945.1 2-amino-4-hydroxy-6-hydroxymethyldihydropteridinediphosphokinase [Prevotella sp. kh1p2]SNU10499.1 2-amino-4-hydroxy-6-hydroxymethyldihydropteridinediphosphokinase [Prevotellaceae bacterium KH2P17]